MKMDVNRLNRDELEYELSIRGAFSEHSDVDELRKRVRRLLKLEAEGRLASPIHLPSNTGEELNICSGKIETLRPKIEEFLKGNTADFRKIDAKLQHVTNRLSRLSSGSDEEKRTKSRLLDECLEWMEDVSSAVGPPQKVVEEEDLLTGQFKPDKHSATSQRPEDEGAEGESGKEEFTTQWTPEEPRSARVLFETPVEPSVVLRKTQIPPKDWKIHFSGENDELSLHAFLETVEELMLSRNVSERDLFDSAFDLFRGKALVWYRAVRREVGTWKELVAELRAEYEPADYHFRLWDEIRRRTQGPTESIGFYVAVMKNYFHRLPQLPSQSEMLQVVRGNLQPYYLERLSLQNIESLNELVAVGRKLEETRRRISAQRPPPLPRDSLEPDLAYTPPRRRQEVNIQAIEEPVCPLNNPPKPEFRCWNCDGNGHAFRRCPDPKRQFCTGCGRKEMFKSQCPTCRSVPGNGQASQA
ncbi:uncharacterized protein LOC106672755 [Cimex lectularius]|uniref:CCHC-type domain-containing protein n=1 Tax=Cimex lectularius TaxID=79782 RepID=A0A8I6SB28_CIMLE|nr:uncharacterized protein LOC106672755 [Cimex lectularius]